MRKWNIFSVLRYHFIAVLIVFLVFAAGAEILFPNTDRRIVYGGCLLLALLLLTVVFNILPGSPDRVALRRKERRARAFERKRRQKTAWHNKYVADKLEREAPNSYDAYRWRNIANKTKKDL